MDQTVNAASVDGMTAGDEGYVPDRDVLALWAELRTRVPMAAILEMARQDLEVMADETSDPAEVRSFEEAATLIGRVRRFVRATQR